MTDFRTDVYNKENKERFLASVGIDKYPNRWWERLFEKSNDLEEYRGKDLFCFTTNEILEFYKILEAKTLSPLLVVNINLMKYGDWGLSEHLVVDGQNHFREIDKELLMQCISKVRLQNSLLLGNSFKEFINELYNDQDKYIFWCLYEGIKGKNYEEIINLKMDDIDESKGIVHTCTGRKVKVSQDFINICKIADKETVYISINEKMIEKPLKISGCIYKEKSNSRSIDIKRSVYAAISRNISYFLNNSSISSKTIRDSGLIMALNERAEKYNMTVRELLSVDNVKYCEDIIYKYNFNIDVKARFCTEYQDYLK